MTMARISVDVPAPDFALEDFRGEVFRLADLKGEKHVLLVLNRGFM